MASTIPRSRVTDRQRRGRRRRSQTGAAAVVAGTAWLWSREDMAGIGGRPVRRRSRPVVAGQRRWRSPPAAQRSSCSAIRSSSTSPPRARIRRAPSARRWRTCSTTHPTMPDHLGLFLETTWRLHPDLCDFTSEVFYEDRLEPESHLAGQLLRGAPPTDGDRPAPPAGRCTRATTTTRSRRRRSWRRSAAPLVNGGTWVDETGSRDAHRLAGRPHRGRVQRPGRRDPEASAASRRGSARSTSSRARRRRSRSTPWRHRPPRTRRAAWSSSTAGNRLNVATSRARCVAVVVASPELLRVRARSPEEMRLANALARFAELAGDSGPGYWAAPRAEPLIGVSASLDT